MMLQKILCAAPVAQICHNFQQTEECKFELDIHQISACCCDEEIPAACQEFVTCMEMLQHQTAPRQVLLHGTPDGQEYP